MPSYLQEVNFCHEHEDAESKLQFWLEATDYVDNGQDRSGWPRRDGFQHHGMCDIVTLHSLCQAGGYVGNNSTSVI